MNTLDLIAIRDATVADRDFIFATWLRGLRYGNSWFEAIDSNSYFKIYQKVIEAILAKPNVKAKIACLKDDPEVILGYCIYSNNRLDWVFVKKAWRSIGIAKNLVPSNITVVSHLTNTGLSIIKKHPGIHFNPFNLD